MSIVLESRRLVLKPLAAEDFEAHAAMMADPAVAQFLTVDRKPQAKSAEWRGYATLLGHWALRGFGFFSVFERASGEWVGRVGPWMPEGWPGLECGWAVARPHWGKGYAAEAALAAIRWTFEEHEDLSRIISLIHPANANSQAVARKIGEAKTGEAYSFAPWIDLDIWAAARDEWLDRFGRG
jgi:RimJ/RimL family protein N-acetyltransferase